MFLTIFSWLKKWCRRDSPAESVDMPTPQELNTLFLTACSIGDYVKVDSLLKEHKEILNITEGLVKAKETNSDNVIRTLIENNLLDQKAIDEMLVDSCTNNKLSLSEFLVTKGASIVKGLRVAKSHNIIIMLKKYDYNNQHANK